MQPCYSLFMWVAALFAVFISATSISFAVTPEMTRLKKYESIIKQLGGFNAQWDLSEVPQTTVFPSASSYKLVQLSTSSLTSPQDLEVFEVNNDLISDGYRNLVYVDWKTGQLWIQRNGGLAGRIYSYGPITLSSEGEIIFPKKPSGEGDAK